MHRRSEFLDLAALECQVHFFSRRRRPGLRCRRQRRTLRVPWHVALRSARRPALPTCELTTTADYDEPCCSGLATTMDRSRWAARSTTVAPRCARTRLPYIVGLALLALSDTKDEVTEFGLDTDPR